MIASVEDVQARFFRELTEEEQTLVDARLGDAENRIRSRIPDFEQRLVEEPMFEPAVISVCCDAVIRLVRNPEGFVQETDGNYTYMLAQTSLDGRLTILPEEWSALGVRSSVGVVHIAPDVPWLG